VQGLGSCNRIDDTDWRSDELYEQDTFTVGGSEVTGRLSDTPVSGDCIQAFIRDVLVAVDVPTKDAEVVADLMVRADLFGSDAHGIFRLPHYVARIRGGAVNLRPHVTIARETPATAVIDGDNALGHLVMNTAAQTAIEKAETCGIAWVGAFNSNHAGAGAVYTRMALEHDMIGIYGAVASGNAMAPFGGADLLLGTNPISVAIPTASGPPVVLDMATTVASNGKIKHAALRGESIPEGWVLDWEGNSITDPKRASEGSLAPAGGPKGSGLSLVLGLLAGSLNGARMGSAVVNFNTDLHSVTNTGHFICALSLAAFGDPDELKGRMSTVADEIRSSRPISANGHVRVPGDESSRKLAENTSNGISLPDELVQSLDSLAAELGLPRLLEAGQ
jgi:LDH2 family malate/lactate/ureidoglycolate dehydrogenase